MADEEMKEKIRKEEKVKKEEKKENSDEIIELKKQIETQKIELEETEDRMKRIAAEFDNYKKRSSKERETMHGSMLADIIVKFLPVLDNLEKAAESHTDDENYKQGIE